MIIFFASDDIVYLLGQGPGFLWERMEDLLKVTMDTEIARTEKAPNHRRIRTLVEKARKKFRVTKSSSVRSRYGIWYQVDGNKDKSPANRKMK